MATVTGLKAARILQMEADLTNRIEALEGGRDILLTSLTGAAARRTATVDIGAPRVTVLTTQASHPLRARWYPSAALRTADLERSVTEDPGPGAGCLLEVVFASNLLDIPLAPTADLYSFGDTNLVYLVIDTLEAVSVDVGILFHPEEVNPIQS